MVQNQIKHQLSAILGRQVLIIAPILTGVHFCLAKFAIALSLENGGSAFWPSAGLYLALVLLLGYRIWPAILFSELIINRLLFYENIFTTTLISCIDLIDPLLTTFLITRLLQPRHLLDNSQNVFKFLAILPISPTLTTTLATTTLCLNQIAPWSAYGELWQTWWFSIIAGQLLIMPGIVAWTSKPRQKFSQRQIFEFSCLLALAIAISQIAFWLNYPVEYTLIPLLIWSVFRFGDQGSTLVVVIVSAITAWGTAHGYGSFVRESTNESLLLLQSFMIVVAITTYILCAILNENKQASTNLAQANEKLEQRVEERTAELTKTLTELQQAQTQLIQSEKMSSLGQLVAGVAHEINNPVNFIHGNLIHASEYTQDLLRLLQLYQEYFPNPPQVIEDEIEAIDLKFIHEDLNKLLKSMQFGSERIREIVKSLRNFSRLDEAEFKAVNIHDGIDSTLMILQNRLKTKPEYQDIQVIKNYGKIPLVECYPGQLNQVFMNLLSNAIDALEERHGRSTYVELIANPSWIRIVTEQIRENWIAIRIADNGIGMSENIAAKIFDPFYTTKAIGKGTGLGLSISFQIIREKHQGQIFCNSNPGRGSEFVIEIPIQQKFN